MNTMEGRFLEAPAADICVQRADHLTECDIIRVNSGNIFVFVEGLKLRCGPTKGSIFRW